MQHRHNLLRLSHHSFATFADKREEHARGRIPSDSRAKPHQSFPTIPSRTRIDMRIFNFGTSTTSPFAEKPSFFSFEELETLTGRSARKYLQAMNAPLDITDDGVKCSVCRKCSAIRISSQDAVTDTQSVRHETSWLVMSSRRSSLQFVDCREQTVANQTSALKKTISPTFSINSLAVEGGSEAEPQTHSETTSISERSYVRPSGFETSLHAFCNGLCCLSETHETFPSSPSLTLHDRRGLKVQVLIDSIQGFPFDLRHSPVEVGPPSTMFGGFDAEETKQTRWNFGRKMLSLIRSSVDRLKVLV